MTSALLPIYDRDLTLVKGKGSRLWDSTGRDYQGIKDHAGRVVPYFHVPVFPHFHEHDI